MILFPKISFSEDLVERTLFERDSLQAREFIQKGLDYGELGDYEMAIKFLEKGYEIRKRLHGENSPILAQSYVNMGLYIGRLGDNETAIIYFKRAELLMRQDYEAWKPFFGYVYTNLADVYKRMGDYNRALEYNQSALKAFSMDTVKFRRIIFRTRVALVNIYYKLNLYKEALDVIEESLSNSTEEMVPWFNNLLAIIYKKLDEYELSSRYYQRSINDLIAMYGEDYFKLASEYENYSRLLLDARKLEEAYVINHKSEDLVLKHYGEKSIWYSRVMVNYGDYFYLKSAEAKQMDDFRNVREQNLKDAINYYQKAIIAVIDSFDIEEPFSDPVLEGVISNVNLLRSLKKKALAMSTLADLYLSEFDYDRSTKYLQGALSSLNLSTEVVHRLRSGFLNEDSKLFLAENEEETFLQAIEVVNKLYKQTIKNEYLDLAFEFAEKSKSAVFLASVKDVKAKEFGGIPDSLLKREEYLKGNIDTYKEMLFEENRKDKPNVEKTNLYESKIFTYNNEYSDLIGTFEKDYPNYYSFKYKNNVISLKQTQDRLRGNEALVEFMIDEPKDEESKGKIFRIVVTKNLVDISSEDIDYSYVEDITFMHKFLTSTSYLYTRKKDFEDYSLAAYGLYQKLIKPIDSLLKDKNVTIVPDDKLSYIPFDALLSEMPDTSTMNFRDLPYLIYDYSIDYTYSATLLFNYFEKGKTATNGLAAFAPSYGTIGESRANIIGDESKFLLPLPGTKKEIEQVEKYVSGKLFEDTAAQEETFKMIANESDVLHLAMHTVINDSLPMFSKLIFSYPEDTLEDGLLNTHEIYNLKLKARMAVLSACNTGTGKLQKGEGVMSLARAFLYAGCPSIVMTLWQVEDQSGTMIMKDFYKYLARGKSKSEALRMSKLNHIKAADPLKAHPHYWLAYVNIGNPDPIYTSKYIYFIVVIFFAIVFIFLDRFSKIKKAREKRA